MDIETSSENQLEQSNKLDLSQYFEDNGGNSEKDRGSSSVSNKRPSKKSTRNTRKSMKVMQLEGLVPKDGVKFDVKIDLKNLNVKIDRSCMFKVQLRAKEKGIFKLMSKKYQIEKPENNEIFEAYVPFSSSDNFCKNTFLSQENENGAYKSKIWLLQIFCDDQIVNTQEIDIAQYVDKVQEITVIKPEDCVATMLEFMVSVQNAANLQMRKSSSFQGTSPRHSKSMQVNRKLNTIIEIQDAEKSNQSSILESSPKNKQKSIIKDFEDKIAKIEQESAQKIEKMGLDINFKDRMISSLELQLAEQQKKINKIPELHDIYRKQQNKQQKEIESYQNEIKNLKNKEVENIPDIDQHMVKELMRENEDLKKQLRYSKYVISEHGQQKSSIDTHTKDFFKIETRTPQEIVRDALNEDEQDDFNKESYFNNRVSFNVSKYSLNNNDFY